MALILYAWISMCLALPSSILCTAQSQPPLIDSLLDSAFTASSFFDTDTVPQHSRYSVVDNAWCTATSTDLPNEYLQIDLGRTVKIYSIGTKAACPSGGCLFWVTHYEFYYSVSEPTAFDEMTAYNNAEVLIGNIDDDAEVPHTLNSPIIARFLRVRPVTYYSFPCLKFEAYGHDSTLNPTLSPSQSPTEIPSEPPTAPPSIHPTAFPSDAPTIGPTVGDEGKVDDDDTDSDKDPDDDSKTTNQNDSAALSNGAVIGIILGGGFCVLSVIALALCYRHKQLQKAETVKGAIDRRESLELAIDRSSVADAPGALSANNTSGAHAVVLAVDAGEADDSDSKNAGLQGQNVNVEDADNAATLLSNAANTRRASVDAALPSQVAENSESSDEDDNGDAIYLRGNKTTAHPEIPDPGLEQENDTEDEDLYAKPLSTQKMTTL